MGELLCQALHMAHGHACIVINICMAVTLSSSLDITRYIMFLRENGGVASDKKGILLLGSDAVVV